MKSLQGLSLGSQVSRPMPNHMMADRWDQTPPKDCFLCTALLMLPCTLRLVPTAPAQPFLQLMSRWWQ